jgi:hypothetical protein
VGEDAHATAGREAGATVWGPRRSATMVGDLSETRVNVPLPAVYKVAFS